MSLCLLLGFDSYCLILISYYTQFDDYLDVTNTHILLIVKEYTNVFFLKMQNYNGKKYFHSLSAALNKQMSDYHFMCEKNVKSQKY